MTQAEDVSYLIAAWIFASMYSLSLFRLANAMCGGCVGDGQRNIAQRVWAAHRGSGHYSIQPELGYLPQSTRKEYNQKKKHVRDSMRTGSSSVRLVLVRRGRFQGNDGSGTRASGGCSSLPKTRERQQWSMGVARDRRHWSHLNHHMARGGGRRH